MKVLLKKECHWKTLSTTYFAGQKSSGSCAQCTGPTNRQHPNGSKKKKKKKKKGNTNTAPETRIQTYTKSFFDVGAILWVTWFYRHDIVSEMHYLKVMISLEQRALYEALLWLSWSALRSARLAYE